MGRRCKRWVGEGEIMVTKRSHIKCPKCGGVANRIWPIKISKGGRSVTALVECWSGDVELNRASHAHFFKIRISV